MSSPLRHPAILFDRDGTLIEDCGYLSSPSQVHWLPGVLDGLAKLHCEGLLLVTVSNQSGVARRRFTLSDLQAIEAKIRTDCEAAGAFLAGQYYCPHLPEISGACTCRKPNNGMLEQAIQELSLDRARTWMVGDSPRDCEAGERSGLRCFTVAKNQGLAAFLQFLSLHPS